MSPHLLAAALAACALLTPVPGQSLLRQHRGEAPFSSWGDTVAAAGDVNDDGYDDLIAGSGLFMTTSGTQGKVKVYSGRDGAVLHEWRGVFDDEYGFAADGAGDVDGDGFDDLIVGAPGLPSQPPGVVDVRSGRTGAFLYTFSGTSTARIGYSVAGVGDANGDGYDDFAFGVPYESPRGSVRVYSGRNGLLLRTLVSTSNGDEFGRTIAGAGDVNGDGFDDMVVAAPLARRVDLFSGLDGTLLRTYSGTVAEAGLGTSLAAGKDIDGDGRPDYVAGSPTADIAGTDSGVVMLFLSGSAGRPVYSGAAGDGVGNAVALGDVDGDGRADVVVGARTRGQTLVLGVGLQAIYSVTDSANRDLGAAVACFDCDGDGFDDVAVGAPLDSPNATGTVLVLRGTSTRTETEVVRPNNGAELNLGTVVDSGSDVNGDGYDDVLITAPGYPTTGAPQGLARIISGRDGSQIDSLVGIEYAMGAVGRAAMLGDLNGDGFDDWIGSGIFNSEGYAIVRSGAGGTLYDRGRFLGNVLSVARAGDVDADGRPDFVLNYFSTANGRFARVYSGATGNQIQVILDYDVRGAGGDWDSDGHDDLIASHSSGSTTIWSGANGNPIAVIPFFGGEPAGDADGNGSPDLLFPAQNSQPAGLLLGSTFRYFPGTWTLLKNVGDVDGDGRPDQACGRSGEVRVFSGATGFLLRTLTGTVASQFGFAAAGGDLDRDGRADVIVGAPTDSGSVGLGSVSIQRSPPRPFPGKNIVYRRGCPGSNGGVPSIALDRPSRFGVSTRLTLRGAPPNAPAAFTLAIGRGEIDLGFLGMPGCLDLLSNIALRIWVSTNPFGQTTIPLPPPATPDFAGLSLYWQWLVFDPAANPVGLTTSDGLQETLGR